MEMGFYRSLKFHEYLVFVFLAEDSLVFDFRNFLASSNSMRLFTALNIIYYRHGPH